MRILKISGENLASLGAFALDLAAPPLRDAGVFCITGPTGSGKSTLLDAMCLALYNRIPRQIERSGISLTLNQTDTMGLSDPRQIVRHGAISAFAQVEFSVKEIHYRAKWSVDRAHRQAKGKLQEPRLVLENLTTHQVISDGGKRSTLAAIEQILGLSFEQFCRSVLLAQGDFALFLRARKDERAELLEKLTGSEIYSRVSIEVYRRAAAAAQKAALHQAQIDSIALWDDAERAVANATLATIHAQHAQTALQLEQNGVELAALERADLAQQAYAQAQRALVALLDSPAQQPDAIGAAAIAMRDQLNARLERALVLSTQISAVELGLAQSREQHSATARAIQTLGQQQLANQSARTALEQRKLSRQEWLAQHPHVAIWAARGPELRDQILAAGRDHQLSAQQMRRIGDEAQQLAALLTQQQAQSARVDSEEQLVAAGTQALVRAANALDALKTQHPAETRALCRRELNAQQLNLMQAQSLNERALLAQSQQQASVASEQQWQQEIQQRERAANALQQTQQHEQSLLAERLLDQQQAQAAAELAARRPELLRPEQPCPLCGSRDHPAAAHPLPADTVLQRARDAYRSAELALHTTQQQLNAAREALITAQQSASNTLLQSQRWRDERAQLQQNWEALLAQTSAPEIGSTSAAAWLRQTIDTTATAQLALEEVDREEQRCIAELTAAQTASNQAQAALGEQQSKLKSLSQSLQKLRDSHSVLEREHAAVAARVAQSQQALQATLESLPDWQQQLAQTPEALARMVDASAQRWHEHTTSLLALEREAEQLTQQHLQLEDRHAHLAQDLLAREQQCATQAQNLAALQQAYAVQTDGKSLALLQQHLETLREALTRWQQCQIAAQAATSQAPTVALADIRMQRAQLQQELNTLAESRGALAARIEDDQRKQQQRGEQLAAAQTELQLSDEWEALNSVVGSADGKKFRSFAQNLTLELLLSASNHYLNTLRPRYALKRIDTHDMEIAVLDHELGDELRGVHTLSGGETFLVSLALALGLSALSAQRVEIESLFIDEGFGALDPIALEDTLELLDRVQAQGRQIGLVSHITELAERVGVRVAVVPQALGLSRVVIGL